MKADISHHSSSLKETLRVWVVKLTKEVERQTGSPLLVLPTSYDWSGKMEEPRFIADLGHCVIYIGVRSVGYATYMPVLVVSEKRKRKYRPGNGQSRLYTPRGASGEANFKLAVRNALARNRDIDLLSKIDSEKGEVASLNLPKGVMIKKTEDGKYVFNALNQVLSYGHVEAILHILERGEKYIHGVESTHISPKA